MIYRYFVLLVFLVSCTSSKTQTKYDKYTDIYREKPLVVLVLPPINKTTAVDAKEFYLTTIAEPLSYAGYYTLPIPVANYILKSEGLFDSEVLTENHLKKFKEIFGVDAVLYTTLHDWTTSYYVVGGNVSVEVEFDMKSTNTYRSLWSHKAKLKVDTTVSTSDSAIGNIVATAVKTAVTDYVPIARRINNSIIEQTLPYGKYHPLVDQDRLDLVSDEIVIRPKMCLKQLLYIFASCD